MITSKVIKFNIFSKTENNLEKKLFSFSLILFLILGIMYLYFVGDTTFNIIKRKEINNNTQSISSEIRELELEYLTLNQKINLNLAYSLGFKDLEKVYFTSSHVQAMARNTILLENDI